VNITPHIVVAEAGAAADWYVNAFGAVEVSRVRLPGGGVMTIELRVGETPLHVASEFPGAGILSPQTIGGTATVLQIAVDDAQSAWDRALEAGATAHHDLSEQPWGELHGQLDDPFGHRWNIAQHLRDVPPEEVEAAVAKMFGG
jgi:uncharacterized glyoxalase superfamily protein PhnB